MKENEEPINKQCDFGQAVFLYRFALSGKLGPWSETPYRSKIQCLPLGDHN